MCIANSSSVLLPFLAGVSMSGGLYLALTDPSTGELTMLWRLSRGRVASVLSAYQWLRALPALVLILALIAGGAA